MHKCKTRICLDEVTCSLTAVLTTALCPVLMLQASPAVAQDQGRNAVGMTVEDIGLASGFQDTWLGHHKRGRACVAADFDLDGWIDFYVGNPGDESFVMRHAGLDASGQPSFEFVQVLTDGAMAFGGSSADYDNDGDYDIYISAGGPLAVGFDFLFKNLWVETGSLLFHDVTAEAGIAGPIPDGEKEPREVSGGGGVWSDYDKDGDVDLFVSVSGGRNVLWRNNGDRTFTDVTQTVGLIVTTSETRHSTFFDFDNDGDSDLYENNWRALNVLWRNMLTETGQATFEDVTAAMSPPGENLRYPSSSFVSGTADFNNDGWQDLMAFVRNEEAQGSPYGEGDVVFMNQGGTGFINQAPVFGLLGGDCSTTIDHVMGCQLGDLNDDGIVDVYIGNGGPNRGAEDFLYLSDSPNVTSPAYQDISCMIQYPAEEDPDIVYPPYPYRTHGTCFVDVTGNGHVEMAVVNGGTAQADDIVREPNRLFQFTFPHDHRFIDILPVGNGDTVSWDAIGTRMAVTVRNALDEVWTVRNTVLAGNCFSAQNGFSLHFGLRDAVQIDEIEILWPDGTVQTYGPELMPLDSRMVVTRWLKGDTNGDGAIQLIDLAGIADCLRGPIGGYASLKCAGLDMDGDHDTDLADFRTVQQVLAAK